MESEFTNPALGALGFLLDLEAPLRDLASLIIALDLIVSAPDGIDGEDMPGAKIVAACARERATGLRQAWREAAERARARRVLGVTGLRMRSGECEASLVT